MQLTFHCESRLTCANLHSKSENAKYENSKWDEFNSKSDKIAQRESRNDDQPQLAMKASWRENLEPKCRLEGAGRIELWEVLSRCSRASAKAPIKQFEASFAPQVLSFPDQRDTSTPVRPLEKKRKNTKYQLVMETIIGKTHLINYN